MQCISSALVVAILLFFASGCSVFIAAGGKDVESQLSAGASGATIENLVGKPTHDEVFESGAAPTTQTSDGKAARVGWYAEYWFKGRADDMEQFQDLGMLDAMTLGIGEVLAFPMAIIRSWQLADNVHEYHVWYDAEGKCAAYKSTHRG